MSRPELSPRPPVKEPAAARTTPSETRPVPKTRVLHAIVPADAHRQARVAAAASELPFREFLTHLLRKAQPIRPS